MTGSHILVKARQSRIAALASIKNSSRPRRMTSKVARFHSETIERAAILETELFQIFDHHRPAA